MKEYSKGRPRLKAALSILILAGLFCLVYRSALAVSYGVNLLVNGNAEAGVSSATGDPVAVPGWTTSSAFTVVPYGAAGGFPKASDPGPPDRANQFFAGGNAATSTAKQDIDVSANAADINTGKVVLDLSGWLGGYMTDPDTAELSVSFLDGGSIVLGGATIGSVTPADRNNATGLFLRNKSFRLPVNTVLVRVTLTMTRTNGVFNDGYADSLVVLLRAPTVVTTTADSGPGSLRAALAVGSTITFDPTVFAASSAPHVISLATSLPYLSNDVQILGPGANVLTVQRSTAAGIDQFSVFTLNSFATVAGNGQRPAVTISGITIANGDAPDVGGGGIFNNTGALTVTDCEITGNNAENGGGIFNNANTSCTVTGSTINANSAGEAAAMFTYSSSSFLDHCTISGNSDTALPYNIVVAGYVAPASIKLSNCTIVSADPISAIANGSSTAVYLDNTILFSTSEDPNLMTDGAAMIVSNDYNLSNRDDSAYLNKAHDRKNTDPMLGPLQDNGGGTLTHALLAGSLAIDKGNSTASADQRGAPRPVDDPNSINGGGNNSDIGAFEYQGAAPALLANISTRLSVQTGDNALIAGFIVTGYQPKKVIIRGLGPSLPLAGVLADPILQLNDGSGQLLESNDNWMDSSNKQAIIDSTIPPTNNLESAILRTLPAENAAYTALLRGVNDGTGIGAVEVYDLDGTVDSKLANISTRGLVQTGDNVLIGGLIVTGPNAQKVIIRAIGPSLPVNGKLADPTLELHDQNGAFLESNDNWMDSPNKQAIIDSTIPPSNDLESAIVRTVPPGNYTAIVRGAGDTTGIALVEVYALN